MACLFRLQRSAKNHNMFYRPTLAFLRIQFHKLLPVPHQRRPVRHVPFLNPESVTIPPAPSTAPINIPRCLPTAPPIDANDAQSQ